MEKQVAVIFAGVNGYLDPLPTKSLVKWQSEYIAFIENSHPDILSEIREKKAISDDLNRQMRSALEEFNKMFVPEVEALVKV